MHINVVNIKLYVYSLSRFSNHKYIYFVLNKWDGYFESFECSSLKYKTNKLKNTYFTETGCTGDKIID